MRDWQVGAVAGEGLYTEREEGLWAMGGMKCLRCLLYVLFAPTCPRLLGLLAVAVSPLTRRSALDHYRHSEKNRPRSMALAGWLVRSFVDRDKIWSCRLSVVIRSVAT